MQTYCDFLNEFSNIRQSCLDFSTCAHMVLSVWFWWVCCNKQSLQPWIMNICCLKTKTITSNATFFFFFINLDSFFMTHSQTFLDPPAAETKCWMRLIHFYVALELIFYVCFCLVFVHIYIYTHIYRIKHLGTHSTNHWWSKSKSSLSGNFVNFFTTKKNVATRKLSKLYLYNNIRGSM